MSFAIKKTASSVRTGLMLVVSILMSAQLIHMSFGLIEQWNSIVQVAGSVGVSAPVVDFLAALFKFSAMCWLATFAGLLSCLYLLACCFAFSRSYRGDEMAGLVGEHQP